MRLLRPSAKRSRASAMSACCSKSISRGRGISKCRSSPTRRASRPGRVEAGVGTGDSTGVHYDPMIAKLIAWDGDRPAALRRLRAAPAEYQLAGPANNISFLSRLVAHPAFAHADRETELLDTH